MPYCPRGCLFGRPAFNDPKETAQASVEASGSTTPMLPLEKEMEVGNVDSPVRTAEDEFLNDSDQEDS